MEGKRRRRVTCRRCEAWEEKVRYHPVCCKGGSGSLKLTKPAVLKIHGWGSSIIKGCICGLVIGSGDVKGTNRAWGETRESASMGLEEVLACVLFTVKKLAEADVMLPEEVSVLQCVTVVKLVWVTTDDARAGGDTGGPRLDSIECGTVDVVEGVRMVIIGWNKVIGILDERGDRVLGV